MAISPIRSKGFQKGYVCRRQRSVTWLNVGINLDTNIVRWNEEVFKQPVNAAGATGVSDVTAESHANLGCRELRKKNVGARIA